MNQRVRQRPLAIGPLRAFEAVARLLSFRAAGEELHLTQSAVSRQIQSLEEEIGVPLLTRGTRQVALTSAGATLLRATLPALGQLDAAVQQVRRTSVRPRVSITTFASFASLWLIRKRGLKALYPDGQAMSTIG
jgi:LysR family glycine cleavage system transcriptional activator